MTELTPEEIEARIQAAKETKGQEWEEKITRYGDKVGMVATGIIRMSQLYVETHEDSKFIDHDEAIKALFVAAEGMMDLIGDAQEILGKQVT